MAYKRTGYIGDTIAIALGPLTQSDGTTALDLTSLLIELNLRKNGASADAIDWDSTTNASKCVVSGASSNVVTWTIDATTSATLTAGYYTGTIKVTDGSGNEKSYPDAETGPMVLNIRARRGV